MLIWTNNASTTISGSITATDTSVALSSGTGIEFPNPTGGDIFKATFYDQATKTINEIVHVTARAGDVCTIVRGQEGTTPRAWNAGDIFANLITAGTLASFQQIGPGMPDTSVVYVGIDTGDQHNIVASTIPFFDASHPYATGMLFNIKMANSKFPLVGTNEIMVQLNGKAAQPVRRTDGSQFLGGELVGSEEFILIWNGTYFSSTIEPIPLNPPQTVFYVRPDSTSIIDSNGLESNTGFADTPSQAFKTIQGAVNTISHRYISQAGITIRVADGTYASGVAYNGTYIAGWTIIGNITNPQNCIINCTSNAVASYVPGSQAGKCVGAADGASITMEGFTFYSYLSNVQTELGYINLVNINFNSPVGGAGSTVLCTGGGIAIWGTCSYTGGSYANALFSSFGPGSIALGLYDVLSGPGQLNLNIVGSPNTRCVCEGTGGGMVGIENHAFTPTGMCNGPRYLASTAGGVFSTTGDLSVIPGNQPGVIVPPGWASGGG